MSATYLRAPEPEYPRVAREEFVEGLVVLRVRVSVSGMPEEVRIDRSSGSTVLDRAAAEGVRRWTFAPARLGTEAVESWIAVPIRFRLG